MGLLFKVRMSSFLVGAAAASVAGFYLLYKDYKLTHYALAQQISSVYQSLKERYEGLNARVSALENPKGSDAYSTTDISLIPSLCYLKLQKYLPWHQIKIDRDIANVFVGYSLNPLKK